MNANPAPRRLPRRLVLALAAFLGVAVAVAWQALDRTDAPARPHVLIVGTAEAADAPKAPAAPPPPDAAAAPAAPPAPPSAPPPGRSDEPTPGRSAEITIDDKGVRIEHAPSGSRRHGVVVRGSLDDAMSDVPPWVGTIAILSVVLVFLVPLLAIALVVGYKMRRTRMLNETLVKLAEKGIPPPPEALQALGGSASIMAVVPPPAPPGTPAYEQAKAVRKRAAWSDLRKGVLATAVGLGFVVYSMLDDQSANWLGLVLVFVGVGYIVLWYFEDPGTRGGAGSNPTGGA